MFNISLPELLIVMAIVLIVFGPKRLPEFARSFGKLMGMVKKQSDGLRRELYNTVYAPAEDFQNKVRESTRELRSLALSEENCENTGKTQKLSDVNDQKRLQESAYNSDDLSDHPEREEPAHEDTDPAEDELKEQKE